MVLKTIVAAAAMSAIAAVAQAATFNIDLNLDGKVRQFGTNTGADTVSVTGFIETDASTGDLTSANISDWLITISDGNTTMTTRKGDVGAQFVGDNSFSIVGDDLVSSSFFLGTWANLGTHKSTTALRYTGTEIVAFAYTGATWQPENGVKGFSGPVASPALIGEQLRIGQLQVADVPPVPLPATGLLLLAGLGLYGGLRRKA